MTQRPVGEVLLRNASGEQLIPIDHHNLYVRGVAAFCSALKGEGMPAASAQDGVRSLGVALAIAESCQSRAAVRISNPFL